MIELNIVSNRAVYRNYKKNKVKMRRCIWSGEGGRMLWILNEHHHMLRNLFLLCVFSVTCCKIAISQNNIFPTTGAVGIGTLNPSHPLEIADHSNGYQLRLSLNSTASDDAYLGFQFSKGAEFRGGMFRNKSTDAISLWTGYDGINAALTMLKQNNFVGIGTITPTARLEVLDDNGYEQVKAVGSSARSGFYTQTTSAYGQSNLIVGSERGFSSYGAFLVGGSQNQYSTLFGLPRSDRAFLVADGGFNLGLGIGTLTAQPMIFGTNNAERARLDANGNLSIGSTSSHGFKLSVNGSGLFTRLVVKQYSAWPDYVFAKDYQLMKLSDLEKYIDLHHHLPDIPTEVEVEKMGLDVGSNQATLLKKIEELTLYLIDQNKTILKLQKEVMELNGTKK